MARIDTLANFLTDVATAIKSKTGKTDAITPANFDTEINSIEVGGGGSNNNDKPTSSVLPSGYTQLEYVSARGTQYIDTGFKPTEKTNFEVTFVSHNGFSSNQGSIFGTRYTYNSQAYHLCTFDSRDNVKKGVGCFIFGSQFYTAFMKTDGSKQSISLINGLYTGGDGTTTDLSYVTTTPPDNLYLFAAIDTLGKNVIDYGSLDLYYCSFSENGSKVREFIPARNDNDGTIGLYDTVTDVFYTSNTNTQLIAGPEITVSNTPTTSLNVFIQEEEPETYDGIWLKDNNIMVTGVDFASEFSIFNSWSYDTSVSTPNAVREATNVSVGTDIYVIGGTVDNASSNSMFKYDTVNKTIKSLTPLPYKAYGIAATAFGTDIYIFGGRDGNSGLNKAYKYDTLTDTYTQLTNMPYYSGQFSCVLYHDDIYLFGGHHNGSQLRSAYKYSISTNEYTVLSDLPYAINALTTVVCRDMIYVLGGNNNGPRNGVYVYDVNNNNYTQVSSLPYGVWGAASFVLSPYIILVGGYDAPSGGDYSDKIYIYNTITNETVISPNTLPEKLGRLSGSFVNGYFYIIGAHINDQSSSTNLSEICYSPIYLDTSGYNNHNNSVLLICDNRGIETCISSDGGVNISTKVCGGYYFSNNTVSQNIEVYCGTGTKWEPL